MSIYRYSPSSVIDEVTVKKTDGGALRAYLHTCATSDPQHLTDIITGLTAHGWQCVPSNNDGKSALEVRGFRNEKQLTDQLSYAHWVDGVPKHIKDVATKNNFTDKVKKRSLFASGVSFLIGDAGFVGYGLKDCSPLDMTGGLLYGAGTLSAIIFGRKDQSDLQIRDLSKQMSNYLQKQGVDTSIPSSLTQITTDSNKNLLGKTDDLLRRYPSEMMNLFYAAAGASIFIAAKKRLGAGISEKIKEEGFEAVLKKAGKAFALPHEEAHFRALGTKQALKEMQWESKLDLGVGTFTVGSGLLATLINEKHHDPDEPKSHGLKAIEDWVKERPLRIAGYGYLVSTVCHAASTYIAWNGVNSEHKKAVPLRALFVGTNIIAELLLSISTKGHGSGVVSDPSVDNTIISKAAVYISKQPRKLQPMLIKHVTNFLGQPDILALKDTDVEAQLTIQVEAMRRNPWALAQSAIEPGEKMEMKGSPSSLPNWQAKFALQSATPGLSI